MTGLQTDMLGAVIVAAGSGRRFDDAAKVFRILNGKPVLQRSVEVFLLLPEVQTIVVVLGTHTLDEGTALLNHLDRWRIAVCVGGATRSESVRLGIEALPEHINLVAIHDAARPLVRAPLVRRVVDAAREHGAAIPAVPLNDTILRTSSDGAITNTEAREQLRAAQTPQVARRDWLESALRTGSSHTDEGGALVSAGYSVMTVEGSPDNIKLTWPEDLTTAEALLLRECQ